MRQWMLRVALIASFPALSLAQYAKIDVFGGYTANKFFYTDSGGDSPANAASLFDFGWDRHKGLETSVIGNLNRYLGVKADFSLYSSGVGGTTGNGLPFQVPQKAAYFMAGPEFKIRNRSR